MSAANCTDPGEAVQFAALIAPYALVEQVRDWPHSTFHREVRAGNLPVDWGGEVLHDRRTADVDAGEPSPPEVGEGRGPA